MADHSARRLRVVTLIDSLSNAEGGERIAALVAMGLDPTRFESTLCTSRPSEGDPLVAEVGSSGVRFLSLDRRSKASLLAWRPLIDLIRRERIDILHAHKFGSNLWGTMVGRLARVPVIVAHEHAWSYEGQPLRRFLDREVIARGATVFLAVSHEDQRRMVEIERIRPERTLFLPNGIPPLPATAGDVRTELGIGSEAPVVGAVGGLRPQKAFDVLVDSAASLVPSNPQLRVLIAGSGPEEERLRERIAALGLGATVSLLGRRSDVADVLAALDVAVLCSDFEGSPLAVMEYMAAGRPVVATRVGGVPDLVDHGVTGILVPPRDPARLAAAIGSLLADRSTREAMGERGRERQRREFDLGAMVTRVESLYERLFGATDRAGKEGWRTPANQLDG